MTTGKQRMNILNTKVVDLKEKDKRSAVIPIGTKHRPYPMRYNHTSIGKSGNSVYSQRLGALKSDTNPLLLYSNRDYAEVIGILMREMPTPGMLPMLGVALNQRRPGSKRVLQYFEGAPGAGKTYMSEMIARARTKEGAIKIDCGKKNLGELLFETVLDFGKDRRFYDEFDKRIALYNSEKSAVGRDKIFHPHSLSILKASLGSAFIIEDSQIAINWSDILTDVKNNVSNDKTPEATSTNAENILKRVNDGLRQVGQNEGFGDLGGNALGMATQEGPIIRAWKEGRELVLDEFNRGKEGTTSSLHTVLQFLAGEIDQVTVENTLKEKGSDTGQTFTFRRSDQKLGFFVTATGNSEEDGSDVNELAGSVSSRIVPMFIPVATIEDWQHRICQVMTGLPVSTLYYATESDWKKDPELFREKLQEWRVLGLTASEKENIPELHFKLLQRFEDVLEASEKIATFYYSWSKTVNPDSEFHRAGNLAELLEEIDDRYNSKVAIDFRKIILHMNEALEVRPEAQSDEVVLGIDKNKWDKPPVLDDVQKDVDIASEFGTRLTRVLLDYINSTTVEIGKNRLHQKLIRLAEDNGILMTQFFEAKKNSNRSLSQLLDDNPYISNVPVIKAKNLRDMLCDFLRQQEPFLPEDNEDILPLYKMEQIIEHYTEAQEVEATDMVDDYAIDEAGSAKRLNVFNDDLDEVGINPFTTAQVIDSKSLVSEDDEEDPSEGLSSVSPDAQLLVSKESFLYSLVQPLFREGNLRAVWNNALDQTDIAPEVEETVDGDPVAISENLSKTKLSVATLTVSNDNEQGQTTDLHIVMNHNNEDFVVVGDGALSAGLSHAFNRASLTYVDRTDNAQKVLLDRSLNRITQGKSDVTKDRLKTAFLLRNQLPAIEDHDNASLKDLLLDPNVVNIMPRYLVKVNAAAIG
jgi:hypothetical protein